MIWIFVYAHPTFQISSLIYPLRRSITDWLTVWLATITKDANSFCVCPSEISSVASLLKTRNDNLAQLQLQLPLTSIWTCLRAVISLCDFECHSDSYKHSYIHGYKSNFEQQQWQVSAIIGDINRRVQGVSSTVFSCFFFSWHFSLFKVLAGTQFLLLWLRLQKRLCCASYRGKQFNKWLILLSPIIATST